MNNKKATKRALLTSVMALVMCVVMLVGTTFAWFTDTASTGVNKIQAGNLDITVEYAKEKMNADGTLAGELTEWAPIDDATNVFDPNALWEPGRTEYVVFRITNNGNLALKYKLSLETLAQKPGTNKANEQFYLADYLCASAKVDVGPGEIGSGVSTLGAFMTKLNDLGVAGVQNVLDPEYHPLTDATVNGTLLPGKTNCVPMAIWMPTSVGNEANAISPDKAATIDFGITVVATQDTVENDSFNNKYDEDATYPVASASEMKTALATGGIVSVNKDIKTDNIGDTVADRVSIRKPTTLNLDAKIISPDNMGNNNTNFCALIVDADTTINAGESGGIDTGTNGGYGINVRNGATLTINGGSYYGGGTAVQVQEGTLIINGGTFACEPFSGSYGYNFLINCIDSAYKNGTAKVEIKGGTFVNFDPSNCQAEGAGTNFVADGYKVVSATQTNGDTWYTVVSK